MKFQCGECGKYYRIENSHVLEEGLNIKCTNCDNSFFISPSLSFSSSSESSKIVCENCGKLINEKSKICHSCNLVLNKNHEEMRIDNKHYELLDIDQNVGLGDSSKKRKSKKNGLVIFTTAVVVIFIILVSGYFVRNNQTLFNNHVLKPINKIISGNNRIEETYVVILKSGQTYYADTIEHDGPYIKITTKSGLLTEVAENDVLQISKALIED